MSGNVGDFVGKIGTALNPMTAPFSQTFQPFVNHAAQVAGKMILPKKPTPAAPPAIVQTPTVVPTIDQAAVDTQKKKLSATDVMAGGRASTILTGSQSSDRLGS